jgi:hypothetical protein
MDPIDPYVSALLRRAEDDPDVVGLVLCGSSAEVARRDQWSDHDFLMITADGTPERYRTDLSWLPDSDAIAFSFRETAHGLKALYTSGLMVEFAVFDQDEFAGCALNHYRVALDRGGIAEIASRVHERSMRPRDTDGVAEFRLFLSLIYIGTGRARRGELLSANVMIRAYATEHLIRVARDQLPDPRTTRLDDLDTWRRFETADPELARRLDAALALPIEQAAQSLLDAADAHLPGIWLDYPAADSATVRRLLGW